MVLNLLFIQILYEVIKQVFFSANFFINQCQIGIAKLSCFQTNEIVN